MNKASVVAELKAQGKKPKEISEMTQIPYETVRYHYNEKRKSNNAAKVTEHRRKLKKRAVEYSGGKCMICGYNKCNSSLSFHHTDPSKKDFGFSSKGQSRSWERLRKEIDKTVLVCSNCHGEIHEGLTIITDEIIERQAGARSLPPA